MSDEVETLESLNTKFAQASARRGEALFRIKEWSQIADESEQVQIEAAAKHKELSTKTEVKDGQ